MDCCAHEGPDQGDARFDIKKVADGVHAAVAAPGDVADRDWLRLFRGYVGDMVAAVRAEVATGATLDETKQRVTEKLAPIYEKPLSYGEFRPWRTGVLANIERTYGMVS